MNIEIIEAQEEDRPIVRNMVSYYIYDMAESTGWNIKPNGTFGGCDDLAEYWQTWHPESGSDRWPHEDWQGFPYIVRVDGQLAGFALLKHLGKTLPNTYDIGEFFILRKYRQKGLGKHVAHTLFDRHRGNWEIRQMFSNTPAQAFWRKIISEYTGGKYRDTTEVHPIYGGDELVIQRFSNETISP